MPHVAVCFRNAECCLFRRAPWTSLPDPGAPFIDLLFSSTACGFEPVTTDNISQYDYRNGYREGFRDGFGNGFSNGHEEARSRETREDSQPGGSGDDKGGKKDADPKGGGDGDAARKDADAKDGVKGDDADGADKKDTDKKEDEKDDGKHDEKKDEKPLYKRPVVVLAVLVVLFALLIAAILFWRHSKHHESTDDAFIDGRASAISAQAPGRVARLYVTDNQLVKAGDPLVDIDPRDIQARVDQARAQLVTAESQLGQALAQVEMQRASATQASASTRQSQAERTNTANLLQRYRRVDPDAVSREQADSVAANAQVAAARVDASRSGERAARAQIDAALAQVQTARASIETARANVAAADLQLSYVHVVAPVDGRVTRRSVEVGNVVNVGQALLSVVQTNLWVTANYKETQLDKIRVGLQVDIEVDAFPDVEFHGHVDSIQSGTGAYFSMLPAENATGNYVKVVQRVQVKIVFDDHQIANYPIGPGMSVTPNVRIP
ncbi:MAG: Multidrug export protein EmrA [Rhizobacter sp.]|nr:Multidrug export protein EmrA [Rhizobacter sp.]